jgi:acetyl esterase
MTLDPQARIFLDKMDSLQLPGFHTMPPSESRRLFKAMRGLAARPDPVDSVEDRRTPDGIGLRVYRPLGSGKDLLPVLVFFHGGGWVLGDVDTVDNLCRRLGNASGCAVVSVDYRLAPEVKFPGPLEDCLSAVRFVANESTSFGIDPRRIAVGGDSAGGNLAAAAALSFRENREVAIAFQLLIYPITDFSFDTSGDGLVLGAISRSARGWSFSSGVSSQGERPFRATTRPRDYSGL